MTDPTTVFTDGACSGNPGPGGWAWAVPDGPWASGYDPATTNQRMELQAVLSAVDSLPGVLDVVTDSTYVANCFRDAWFVGWRKRGWRNTAGKPVANQDLWKPLIEAFEAGRFGVPRWVKGHSGDRMNDLVDRLAVEACQLGGGRVGGRAGLMLVGVDTGGTFTDLVADDGTVVKVPSTPDDPGRAVVESMTAAGGRAVERLAHGTTVATNALLERRGAVVALVTTQGHEDVLEIGRQDRPSLYDPFADRPMPLVPRELRFGVAGRLDGRGVEVVPVDAATLPAFGEEVTAVAVCLLHSDLDPAHEQAVLAELARRGIDATASHTVSPEFREYERAVTTTVNAYLRPVCRKYLAGLAVVADEVLVLSSAGGLLPVDIAAELPAALLLSGPAGGVSAAAAVAAVNGFAECVTFDMGGTSTDVCLVRGGVPVVGPEREVAGFPIRLPSLDVHTIGAGGGSIARLDPGGALAVGPRSAGAVPGPACYGRGGTEPTVTDADLVLGRISAVVPFPGVGVLDGAAAAQACSRAGVDPHGVVAVADAHMVGAIRRVTVERGVDPRGLALVAFGGAGPLHACALADALGMAAVLVPARAGVLSAAGILAAPVARELVRTWPDPSSRQGLAQARAALGDEVAALVGPGSEVSTLLDCRYPGQSHELTVASTDDFHAEHRRINGHDRPGSDVEVVALRARASLASPVSVLDLPVPPGRSGGRGPAVIAEPDCTIWVPEGWAATVGEAGALVLRRT